MKYRKFGNTAIELSAIGLGCMSMNHAYGEPDDAESVLTLEKALDLGINFWDTADIYANGANEELVAKVLKPNRQKIFLATKFGFQLNQGSSLTQFDGSPAYMKKAVEASLKRLQTDVIDLYYAHRIDPNIPVEETVGAMAELVKEGKVRYIGLSEASASSVRRAHSVHPISALQSEYSLLTRGVEEQILPVCKELNISFIPFSPLARGLVTNTLDITTLKDGDFRKSLPRFQEQHAKNNKGLTQEFAELAAAKNATAAQLALAWVLAQGDNIIPIPGTKRRKYLTENAAAVNIDVTADDLEKIESLLKKYPDTGERYGAANNKLVDKD
ncbi:Predicted oxidoreductase [Pedobacter westerhofensis]|uniref:Predicted oxidoreductase n=1 Tax=Pedobacter westerhofensis TaxID=425512 RepID=A0A521BEC2_9SPHI|nr:aldo/keto reductase [Pedobacter westerhofensis]SMO45457.1 Predicted oxidoreductase [Pedobacter westerhofensis]